jgi:pre-mRNA-processing factor 6
VLLLLPLLLLLPGEGQRTVIRLKLDSMADSVSGQSVIDPKGYLTDLSSMAINSSSEISDIKKVSPGCSKMLKTSGW